MSFRMHRAAALTVLVAAGLWIGTGHFASVGSEAKAASGEGATPPETPAENAAPSGLRTVAAIEPVFVDHAREIRVSGLTAADKETMLAARAAGVITELGVAKGAPVAEGTVVMRLEGPEVEAAVETGRAALEQSIKELDIAQKLFDSGNSSEVRLKAAQTAKAAAEAQLSQAVAAADRLQLVAPFSGDVESVEVEVGEYVQPGMPIARLLALAPIVVRAEVSELDVNHIAPGGVAKIRLVTGAEMEGTIRTVGRVASGPTRTFPLEVALPNPDHTIPAGMTAEISVFAAPARAVVVPRSVITLNAEGVIGLRVVGPDDVTRFVPAQIIDDTAQGLVVGGVPEGVRIIVAGQDLVGDGETVRVVPAEGALK